MKTLARSFGSSARIRAACAGLLVGMLMIAVAATGPARSIPIAAQAQIQDPRDGKVLDVQTVSTAPDPTAFRFTVTTWSRWTARRVHDRAFFVIYLDTLEQPGYEYYLLLRSNGRRIGGGIFRVNAGRRSPKVGRVLVTRRGPRTVEAAIRRRQLSIAPARADYGWYVQTILTSRKCRRVCFDRAPDAGEVREPLPAAPPS